MGKIRGVGRRWSATLWITSIMSRANIARHSIFRKQLFRSRAAIDMQPLEALTAFASKDGEAVSGDPRINPVSMSHAVKTRRCEGAYYYESIPFNSPTWFCGAVTPGATWSDLCYLASPLDQFQNPAP